MYGGGASHWGAGVPVVVVEAEPVTGGDASGGKGMEMAEMEGEDDRDEKED